MSLQGDIWTETRVDLCLPSEIQANSRHKGPEAESDGFVSRRERNPGDILEGEEGM